MDQPIVVVAIVVVAVIVIAAVWVALRQRRSQQLRQRFGPEYEHVVAEQGDTGRGERLLSKRTERVEQLHLRPIEPRAAAGFRERWRVVQARFVDDPRAAVSDADELIGEAMEARGYPVGDFEQRAADISVDHPQVVSDYRDAHAIADRSPERVGTEDLRRAMVLYRSLFVELGGSGEASAKNVDAEDRVEVEGHVDGVDEREEQRR